MKPVLHVDAASIRTHLPWSRMLSALHDALRGEVSAPLRTPYVIPVPETLPGTLLMMPAWQVGQRLGVKLVTVFPAPQGAGRSVAAVYVLFDARNGRLLALFDGEEITARRTAGASAYAARALARRDARHLVMVGAGRTARALAMAHASVLPIERISLWSRTYEHALAATSDLADAGLPVKACHDLESAVREADVVSCATLATQPLVHGAWLPPGVHLDLVGAFKASMRETDDDAMRRADLIVVDQRAAALAEGGDIVQSIASNAIRAGSIAADLVDLARGVHPGRVNARQVTVFKSVGFALEDLAAANAVYDAIASPTDQPA